jgi:hypothetical protein
VVDGLHGGDGVQPDAFVGAVQADVIDAEPGSGSNAQAREVVADIGRPGNLGLQRNPAFLGGVEEGPAKQGVLRQRIGRPACTGLDTRRPGTRPRIVQLGSCPFKEVGGSAVVKGGVVRKSTFSVHRSGVTE